MGLSIGIIGLPNVGKSTLFNALTNQKVYAANYPFATIEPNVCYVKFIDKRLDVLSKCFHSERKTYAAIKFVDIAGIIKGSSKGEGLGNKFLSNIREANALVQIVRCFEDKKIPHVNNEIDPINDIETIISELIFADIEVVEKHLVKNRKRNKINDKDLAFRIQTCEKILKAMWQEKLVSNIELNEKELKIIKPLNLLSMKPMIFMFNVYDSDIASGNYLTKKAIEYIKTHFNAKYMVFSALFEEELANVLNNKERNEMAMLVGISEPIVNILVKEAFSLLNLNVFFTSGQKESKAWTYKNGLTAKECAYLIHSDIGNRFIRLEVYKFDDFKNYLNKESLRKNGLIRIEGKDYLVQDGDVCLFHFNTL